MLIRRFRDEDASALLAITRRAIRSTGPAAYTAEQVRVWLETQDDPDVFATRAAQGAVILIAAREDDTPLAFALCEPDGHVDMLYCDPAHARQGLASSLLAALQIWARQTELSHLYAEASELARPVFERAGYRVGERRDFVLNGVAIHNWAMRLDL